MHTICILGVPTLEQRVRRCVASRGVERGGCAGKLDQRNSRRRRNAESYVFCWLHAVSGAMKIENANGKTRGHAAGVQTNQLPSVRRR